MKILTRETDQYLIYSKKTCLNNKDLRPKVQNLLRIKFEVTEQIIPAQEP